MLSRQVYSAHSRPLGYAAYQKLFSTSAKKQNVNAHAVSTEEVLTAKPGMTTAEEFKNAKPFSSIPGPPQLPFIYNLYHMIPILVRRKRNEMDYCMKMHAKYGPVARMRFGPKDSDSLIYIFDPVLVEKLIRHDGLHPRRVSVEAWQSWREEFGHARGILTEDGNETWLRMRMVLNKQMMRPHDVASYSAELMSVTDDFVDRIKRRRDPQTKALDKLDMELFHWSLESIGSVIYETRFGGLSDDRSTETTRWIQAVSDMFRATNYLFYLPRKLNQKVMPKLQAKHDEAWTIIFEKAQTEIDRKFEEIQTQLGKGEEVSGFLSTLLAKGTMSRKEIYGNVTELMAAAVDTTSNSTQFIIYCLSQYPELQSKVRDEVLSISPRGQTPTYDNIQRMTYLKGFIKEVLRLFPTIPSATRVTHQPLVLGGYYIPPDVRVMGMAYVAARNPKYFSDPEKLKPERWQRSSGSEKTNPYAFMTFGFGQRMCIGRRIAEFEMQVLVAKLLQEFDIKPTDSRPNPPITNPFLVPERPVCVKFLDRTT